MQAEVPRRHQRPVQQHDGDPIGPQRRDGRPATARPRARASPRGSRPTPTSGDARPSVRTSATLAAGGGLRARAALRRPRFQTSSTSRSRSSADAGSAMISANAWSGRSSHLEHAADRVARREHAARARRDQQVADDDVGVVREIRQAQAAAVARADGDRAQAVAIHADGHGVVRIGDQHGFGGQRADAHDLADDALRVDQRLADVHAVDEAAVQIEALPVRVEVDGEDLGDERAAADARRRIEQLAQPRVLRLERLEPLQARLRSRAARAGTAGSRRSARRASANVSRSDAQVLNGRSTSTRTG